MVAVDGLLGVQAMTRREQLLKSIATMLASAYWRGRMESIPDGPVKDRAVTAAAECDWERWYSAAKVAAGDSEL